MLALLISFNLLFGQTEISSAIIRGSFDASQASGEVSPFDIGATDPATCTASKRPVFYNTTSNLLKVCDTNNVWTVISGAVSSVTAGATGLMICSPTTGVVVCDADPTFAPAKNGTNAWTGSNDFSGGSKTAPARIGSADPGTCDPTVREQFFNTTSNLLKSCNTANVWTPVGGIVLKGQGGAGSSSATETAILTVLMPLMTTDSVCKGEVTFYKPTTNNTWVLNIRNATAGGTLLGSLDASILLAARTQAAVKFRVSNSAASVQEWSGYWQSAATATAQLDFANTGNAVTRQTIDLSAAWNLVFTAQSTGSSDNIKAMTYDIQCY